MVKQYLLPQKGKFYKVNMHCHSTVSDGKLSLEELKEQFKARGYSAVAFTDHNIMLDHSDLNDESFVAITGYEVDVTCRDKSPVMLSGSSLSVFAHLETVHLNFYPSDPHDTTMVGYDPKYLAMGNSRNYAEQAVYTGDGTYTRVMTPEEINRLIAEGKEIGLRCSYNHPRWSMNTYSMYAALRGIFAFEIINGDCIRQSDMDFTPHVYEEMMRTGIRVPCISGDDCHNLSGLGTGWTMVKAETLSHEALLSAIENGDCYASYGPSFEELWIEDGGILHVRTSDVRAVYLSTAGRRTSYEEAKEGEPYLKEASFQLKAADLCFRLQIKDAKGDRASTRFYYFDELKQEVLPIA